MNNYGILSGKWPYFISISQCYVYTQGTWTFKINVTEKRDYIPSIYFYKPSTLYIKKNLDYWWGVKVLKRKFLYLRERNPFWQKFYGGRRGYFFSIFRFVNEFSLLSHFKIGILPHQHSISVKNRLLKPGVFDEVFTHFSWIISFS